MSIITIYKVQSPESKKIYIGVSVSPFDRLVRTMNSRFRQYKELENKILTKEEQNKMKVYHHICFELLEIGGIITQLAYYECNPTDDISLKKNKLISKFTTQVDPNILITPKRLFKNNRKQYDIKYVQKNKEILRQKALKPHVCEICNGRYVTVNRKTHLSSKKHLSALTIDNSD
jgi:hypothetical protein